MITFKSCLEEVVFFMVNNFSSADFNCILLNNNISVLHFLASFGYSIRLEENNALLILTFTLSLLTGDRIFIFSKSISEIINKIITENVFIDNFK